jgi:hypothetical protein
LTEKIFQVIHPRPNKSVLEKEEGDQLAKPTIGERRCGVEGNEHQSDAADRGGLPEALREPAFLYDAIPQAPSGERSTLLLSPQ